MGPKNIVVAIVLVVALAAGLFVSTRLEQPPAEPRAALVLPAPTPLPEFTLLDQFGNRVTRASFRDEWSLVFFGFTNCPDICPITLQVLATARDGLRAAGHKPLPRIVLVSVDPERDTPELMGKYVSYFGDGNLGLTGSLDELNRLTSALGIYFQKQPGDAENYAVDHSAAVLLFNPEGNLHALFTGPHLTDDYVHDLPIIMEAG